MIAPITEAIQSIILNNGNAMEISAQAKKDGVKDLRESGLLKVKQGLTTLEEYALGGDPSIASQTPLPVLVTNSEGQAFLRFSKPLTHDATDWQLESSQDLLRWSPSTAPLVQRTEQNGLETFVFNLPPPSAPGPVLWRMRFRLR